MFYLFNYDTRQLSKYSKLFLLILFLVESRHFTLYSKGKVKCVTLTTQFVFRKDSFSKVRWSNSKIHPFTQSTRISRKNVLNSKTVCYVHFFSVDFTEESNYNWPEKVGFTILFLGNRPLLWMERLLKEKIWMSDSLIVLKSKTGSREGTS